MKNLKVVTVSIIVEDGTEDLMLDNMMEEVGQLGYYTIDASYRNATEQEVKEVISQVPDDIADEIEEIDEEE